MDFNKTFNFVIYVEIVMLISILAYFVYNFNIYGEINNTPIKIKCMGQNNYGQPYILTYLIDTNYTINDPHNYPKEIKNALLRHSNKILNDTKYKNTSIILFYYTDVKYCPTKKDMQKFKDNDTLLNYCRSQMPLVMYYKTTYNGMGYMEAPGK